MLLFEVKKKRDKNDGSRSIKKLFFRVIINGKISKCSLIHENKATREARRTIDVLLLFFVEVLWNNI